MILRLIVCLVVGSFVMSLEFGMLATLIQLHRDQQDLHSVARIEFTRLHVDSEVATRSRTKPEVAPTVVKPSAPQVAMNANASATAAVAQLALASGGTGGSIDLGGTISQTVLAMAGTDHGAVPLVRLSPDYPERASSQHIEGWVLVEFTITPAGTVKDARAVDAHPKGYFESAATASVLRWKYSPTSQAGMDSDRQGNRVVIRFQLDDKGH